MFNAVRLGFLNYYDAVAFGLKKGSPLMILGGPGGACPDEVTLSSYCWALLDHVQNGVDYFTGTKDVPLDFLSVHKKVDHADAEYLFSWFTMHKFAYT